MRAKKLSARCEAMAAFVGSGERIADIGADHAYLPVYLVREGISPFAVLTDIRPGPLERARASVEKAKVYDRDDSHGPCPFEFRLGDGLETLEEAEVDTVIIAGIGGESIISILKADPRKAGSFKKLILQPRTKTDLLEVWLAGSGWQTLKRITAEEKGRLCDIIVCVPKEEIYDR